MFKWNGEMNLLASRKNGNEKIRRAKPKIWISWLSEKFHQRGENERKSEFRKRKAPKVGF